MFVAVCIMTWEQPGSNKQSDLYADTVRQHLSCDRQYYASNPWQIHHMLSARGQPFLLCMCDSDAEVSLRMSTV